MSQLNVEKAFLVYQGGIANVFAVNAFLYTPDERKAKRLRQGTFTECLEFARGLGAAGTIVRTAHYNGAGDASYANWSKNLEYAHFSDKLVNLSLN